MPGPLQQGGAQLDKPPKYAPIHINRFFTGLWPNRSPLREAAVEYLYEKFYSGSRFDSVWSGQNTELTPRLTWARRPGLSIYNSQTFPAPLTFYPFRVTDPNTGIESIRVMVDTATAVYDGTGPNTKTLIFNKTAGAGQTSFQSVGNVLYMGDGIETVQWIWIPQWQPNFSYAAGTNITVGTGIWQSIGLSLSVTSTAVSSNVLTVDYSGTATLNIGDQWTFNGMTSNPSLNGVSVTVATTGSNTFTAAYTSANYTTTADTGTISNSAEPGVSGATIPSFTFSSGSVLNITQTEMTGHSGHTGNAAFAVVSVSGSPSPALTPGQNYLLQGLTYATWLNNAILVVVNAITSNEFLAANSSHPAYGAHVDTGTASLVGSSSVILDNTVGWIYTSPAVRNWGIIGPNTAPIVANTFSPAGTAWAASTVYWPNLLNVTNTAVIVDANNNIQLLTTAGQTAGSPPAFSSTPGNTTADNTATWTCQGPAARVVSTPYIVGNWIAVTVTTQVQYIRGYNSAGPNRMNPQPIYGYKTVTNYYVFVCTSGGTSSSVATTGITWASGLGGTTTDGTVTWTNAGYQMTRTTSATSSPSSATQGNVGDSTLVTNISSIDDGAGSGGGTGYTQNVTSAGKSGGSHPTWTTPEAVGAITTETSGLQWTNGGPATVPNTGNWLYWYSWGDSVTGHESTASPASIPILLGQNSAISVSGQGDPLWATDGVDTINIYRSTQGEAVPFRLASIPAPANGGAWTFIDTTPDPPNPGATLNEFLEADITGTNAPPPSNIVGLAYHLGRVWGVSNEFVQYSQVQGEEVGVGAESWPGLNYMQMPSTPVVLWPSAAGLFIFTNSSIWLTAGLDGNGNPLAPSLYLDQTGILSPNVFTVNGSVPAIFASDSTFQVLDPSAGVQYVGLPIAELLAAFNSPSCYVTWHSEGTDQGYYVADGSTGWYRVSGLSSPETGYAWSTKANISFDAGCMCVKSIEISPGTRSLLVGTTGSGPIYMRDPTVSTDNSIVYPASLVIGSVILAQPNQCAEIVSITTECLNIGSNVQPSILCDDVNGIFENLTSPQLDPPYLIAPQNILATRWYFSTLQQPAWMRHLMINLTWPSEGHANELLTYSLYGAIHTE